MPMQIQAPTLIAGDKNVGFIFYSTDPGTVSIQVFFFQAADYSTTLNGHQGTASVNILDNSSQFVQVDAHSINATGERAGSYRQYFTVAPAGTPRPVPTRTPVSTIVGDDSGELASTGDGPIAGGVGASTMNTIQEQAAQDEAAKEQAAQDEAAKEQAAQDEAAKEQAAQDEAAKEQAAQDEAAKEQAAQDEAAKEQAAKEEAAEDETA